MDLAVGLSAQSNWPLLIRSLIRSLRVFRGIVLSLASRPSYKSSLAANVEKYGSQPQDLKGLGAVGPIVPQPYDNISLIRFLAP
jgi:hypothetical protein